MNIYLPEVGVKLLLNQPWTFELEDRTHNAAFWEKVTGTTPIRGSGFAASAAPVQITIPAGCILVLTRIHMRRNYPCNFLSFRLLKNTKMPFGSFRVKPDEINKGLNVTVVP